MPWRSFLPSRQGIIDHLWGGLILAGVLAVIAAAAGTAWGLISGGRVVMRPIVLEGLYFIGVLAIAVGVCLLAIRWLERRVGTHRSMEPAKPPGQLPPTMDEMRAQIAAEDAKAADERARERQRQSERERTGVDRFREAYNPPVKSAVMLATDYVVAALFLKPSTKDEGYKLIYHFLEAYVIPPCTSAMVRVDRDVAEPPALVEVLIADLRDLLATYCRLIGYIEHIGKIMLGGHEFYWSEEYSRLRSRHRECLAELRKISQTSWFRPIAADIGALGEVLQPEPVTPAEGARRRGLMEKLRKLYGEETPPEVVEASPPREWMNLVLENWGESWRL